MEVSGPFAPPLDSGFRRNDVGVGMTKEPA